MNARRVRMWMAAVLLPAAAGAASATEPSLPFTVKVTPQQPAHQPDYMGPNNPVDMDFPFCPVEIDGEYWVIYKNGYNQSVSASREPTSKIRSGNPMATPPTSSSTENTCWEACAMMPRNKSPTSPLHAETGRGYYTELLRQIHSPAAPTRG